MEALLCCLLAEERRRTIGHISPHWSTRVQARAEVYSLAGRTFSQTSSGRVLCGKDCYYGYISVNYVCVCVCMHSYIVTYSSSLLARNPVESSFTTVALDKYKTTHDIIAGILSLSTTTTTTTNKCVIHIMHMLLQLHTHTSCSFSTSLLYVGDISMINHKHMYNHSPHHRQVQLPRPTQGAPCCLLIQFLQCVRLLLALLSPPYGQFPHPFPSSRAVPGVQQHR